MMLNYSVAFFELLFKLIEDVLKLVFVNHCPKDQCQKGIINVRNYLAVILFNLVRVVKDNLDDLWKLLLKNLF